MLNHLNEKPINPARVVVLGARGFIGRALVAALQQAGIAVMPVSSADLDLTAEDAGDRLAAMLKPDDAVVLLSALTPDKGRWPKSRRRTWCTSARIRSIRCASA
jgi:UDP-glucose 4-epimerase